MREEPFNWRHAAVNKPLQWIGTPAPGDRSLVGLIPFLPLSVLICFSFIFSRNLPSLLVSFHPSLFVFRQLLLKHVL